MNYRGVLKLFFIVVTLFLLSACAAKLEFVDLNSGDVHYGKTGSTFKGNGSLTAIIEDSFYEGSWVYSNSGSYTLNTANFAINESTNNDPSLGLSQSITGRGLINMRSPEGGYIRCIFNTGSNGGMGRCMHKNGKQFDLMIMR